MSIVDTIQKYPASTSMESMLALFPVAFRILSDVLLLSMVKYFSYVLSSAFFAFRSLDSIPTLSSSSFVESK